MLIFTNIFVPNILVIEHLIHLSNFLFKDKKCLYLKYLLGMSHGPSISHVMET